MALLFVLLYRQLRPFLNVARDFLYTVRHFQQINANRDKPQHEQAEKLVRCESCGTWVPIGRALTAGPQDSVFCSTDCLSGKKQRTGTGS